uniref:Kv3 family voltage-gated potassium channel protein n=1 Tax=Polyorchis penicillatus TaxID=6091 RepID=A0A0A0R5P0_POLPE|nr:Kv3 family voltage-gated potassium channel protein [Polyorchis penicillatus]
MSAARNLHPFSLNSLQAQRERNLPNGSRENVKCDERLILNVGGYRHEVMASTIAFAPDTRLYWITQKKAQSPDYDPLTGEFFFDRNPIWFPYILNYYRLGKIHCPPDVCGSQFEEELQYWGIDESVIDSCCWDNYRKHKKADINLQTLEIGEEEGQSSSLPDIENQMINQHHIETEIYMMPETNAHGYFERHFRKYKPGVWTTLEDPNSSQLAQIYAFLSMLFIIVSVSTFCLETISYFEDPDTFQHQFLFVIESICVTWFCFELVIRFMVCPNKWKFVRNIMNWIDLCAVVPYFISLGFSHHVKTIVVLRIIRLIRVFRILKLSRHSYGLQILGHTLKASCRELCLLVFFLSIGVVIFSSLIYYAEKETEGTKFTSIPSAFWWSIVTMTTIGYGDVVPITLSGKLVGTLCALCGVLVIALPVPVVVSNFSLYYSHAQSKLRTTDGKKTGTEKSGTVRTLHPWFNPGLTNRSSVVSIVSRNSFYVASPAPGTPARLSPTYRGSFNASNFLTLRNNSIPNTPLHSPSFIFDYQSNLSPLPSRRNSLSPQICKKTSLNNIFKFSNTNINSFNYENKNAYEYQTEKSNNSKTCVSKYNNSNANVSNSNLSTDYYSLNVDKKDTTKDSIYNNNDTLTIKVHPPSHSDSETGDNTDPTTDNDLNDFQLNDEVATPVSVNSAFSSKGESLAFTFPSSNDAKKDIMGVDCEIASPDFNKNQHLSPLSYNSPHFSSISASPLSTNSPNFFDYNSSYAGSYESSIASSRKASVSSAKLRNNNVLMLGVLGTRWRKRASVSSHKTISESQSPSYDGQHYYSYPNDKHTRQLHEVSKRLEQYLHAKDKRRHFSFNLAPVDRSTIHTRRHQSKSSLTDFYYTSSAYSSSMEDCVLVSPLYCSPLSKTPSTAGDKHSKKSDYSLSSSVDALPTTPSVLLENQFDFDQTKLAAMEQTLNASNAPKSPKVFLKPTRDQQDDSPCFLFDSSFSDSKKNGKARSDTVINMSSMSGEQQMNLKKKHASDVNSVKKLEINKLNRYRKYNLVSRNVLPVQDKDSLSFLVKPNSVSLNDLTHDPCKKVQLERKKSKSAADLDVS